MKRVLHLVSASGLVLTILPSILFFGGAVEHTTVLSLMLWGMALWFGGILVHRAR